MRATRARMMMTIPSLSGQPRRDSAQVGLITNLFGIGDGIFEGGAERHLLRLAQAMRDRGIGAIVYQPSDRSTDYVIDGVPVCARPVDRRGAWRSLARWALADGMTHLHFQYLEHVPLGLGAPGARAVPVTATQHGVHWDIPYEPHGRDWYRGHKLARCYLPAYRAQELTRSLLALRRTRAVTAMDTSFLRVVQALAPGLRGRLYPTAPFSDLAPDEGTLKASVELLPPPVSESIRAIRARGGCVVLVPRNLSLVRGESWLPLIASQVAEQIPALFIVTGRFMGHLDHQFRAQRLASPDAGGSVGGRLRILLLDGVERAVMSRLYSACDIVLIPTFAHEGASLAAAEAMAFGKAIVTSNVGGLNDTVDDHWTGLVARADVGSLARAVILVVRDPVLRARLGSQARAKASACFNMAAWRRAQRPFFEAAGWSYDNEE